MAVQSETKQDLARRRDEIKSFIDRHFGSQRAFCQATDLKPARVSKALQDRYLTNRRLLPLEHAVDRWKRKHGASLDNEDVSVPVYQLRGGRLRPRGEREPVGYRGVANDVDRERLLYVEVTFAHHCVLELIATEGVPLSELDGTDVDTTLEYACLANSQWVYLDVHFDTQGNASLAGNRVDDVRFFGRSVIKLDVGL